MVDSLRAQERPSSVDERALGPEFVISSRVPAGAILAFASSNVPAGWLSCDGSEYPQEEFPELYEFIGTAWNTGGETSGYFRVPDLRGAFLRGAGSHGAETMADGNPYAGPAVGSFEDDQMQGHDWNLFGDGATTGGADNLDGTSPNNTPSAYNSRSDDDAYRMAGPDTRTATLGKTGGAIIADGTNGTPSIGDETRPFAAGVLYCIKT
jgi:microcystin-dependent protein